MSRGTGWLMAMGLGAALVMGCQESRQSSAQEGRFNEPIHQKNQSPAAAAGENLQAGGGEQGVATDKGWRDHPSAEGNSASHEVGPYYIGRPQPLPRERDVAPFGVGGGSDNARLGAMEQFKKM